MEGFIAENGVKTLSPEASDAIFHYNAVRCGVRAPRLPSASALKDSDIGRISILNPLMLLQDEQRQFLQQKPWLKDPHYFKHVRFGSDHKIVGC